MSSAWSLRASLLRVPRCGRTHSMCPFLRQHRMFSRITHSQANGTQRTALQMLSSNCSRIETNATQRNVGGMILRTRASALTVRRGRTIVTVAAFAPLTLHARTMSLAACGESCMPRLLEPAAHSRTCARSSYLYWPADNYCCSCCTAANGCGIVKPTWMVDAAGTLSAGLLDVETCANLNLYSVECPQACTRAAAARRRLLALGRRIRGTLLGCRFIA